MSSVGGARCGGFHATDGLRSPIRLMTGESKRTDSVDEWGGVRSSSVHAASQTMRGGLVSVRIVAYMSVNWFEY